jgi:hypothetical protein
MEMIYLNCSSLRYYRHSFCFFNEFINYRH